MPYGTNYAAVGEWRNIMTAFMLQTVPVCAAQLLTVLCAAQQLYGSTALPIWRKKEAYNSEIVDNDAGNL